jgi:4-amino-4-deoxy-L-arabinose transferase-like glycosyltransferase
VGDGAAVKGGPRRSALAWPWLAAIFLLALALRALHVAQYEALHPLAPRPVIDEASYDRWARAIAGGDLVGREVFFQEPLYPYALAAVYACAGDDPGVQRRAARYAQAALGAATAALTALLATRIGGRVAGLVAGCLFALHRPAVWFPSLLLKENLFLPALVLLALALLRARESAGAPRRRRLAVWLAVGALAGLGALLRGNLLVLLPPIALWPLASERPRRAALASCAAVAFGAALVLAPVAARNLVVGERLVLTTSGAGTNFYAGNDLANPYGIACELDFVRTTPEHEPGDWRREAERRLGRELDASEVSSYWLDQALRSMRERPAEHAAILWHKLRATLGRYEVPDNHFIEWDARYVPLLRAPLPGFEVTGLVGIAGAIVAALDLARRRARRGTGPVLALAALYLATVVATITSERIRLALVPFFAAFAGFLAADLLREPRSVARWIERGAALAAAAALVLVPALPAEKRAADFDERDLDLAAGWIEAGELERAAPIVGDLAARRPGSARVGLVAASLALRRAGPELDEPVARALDLLDRVARQGNAHERFRANALIGAMAQRYGRFADAERSYRAALAFDPGDRDLRRRLAVSIAEQAMAGPPGEARRFRLEEALAILDRLLADARDEEVERLRARVAGAR